MIGNLQETVIEDLLRNQVVGRIGCHADGETYVVPISFAYDGQYIYCHSYDGKKIDFMRRNPSVCFEVEEMESMANWKSVVVQGTYEEITERPQKNKAMETLLNRYLPLMSSVTTHLGELWPFHPDDMKEVNGIVFRISIREKSGRFESSPESPSIPG